MACSACSSVSRWSARQWSSDGRDDAGPRLELLDGRVRAVRQQSPGVEQRAERVRAVEPVGPVALGELFVRRRVRELERDGDAELGEAADVFRSEALRVLDPLAQAARLPHVARTLERVERGTVRSVADCVDTDGPARLGAVAHDLLELLARRDHDAAPVSHPRGLRAECPVHERLQVAEPEEGRADAAAQADLAELRQSLGRGRLPDAKWERALLLELLPEPDRAEPAVLVVQGSDAAGSRDLDAVAHRFDVLLVGHLDEPALELPRSFLVEDAGGLALLVADDDAAVDLEVAAGERERRPS